MSELERSVLRASSISAKLQHPAKAFDNWVFDPDATLVMREDVLWIMRLYVFRKILAIPMTMTNCF